MIAWLIEYEGAVPAPVYVPETFQPRGCFTMDAWLAKRFQSKAEAELWMGNPKFGDDFCTPFAWPWHAVEHSLPIVCMYCAEDAGFVVTGEQGLCDNCTPF